MCNVLNLFLGGVLELSVFGVIFDFCMYHNILASLWHNYVLVSVFVVALFGTQIFVSLHLTIPTGFLV